MTDEQLRLISEQTEYASRKSLRRYARAATVGFMILFAGLVVERMADERTDRAVLEESIRVGCVADHANATALRDALDGQIEFLRESPPAPPPPLEDRIAAVERLKDRIIVPDCDARVKEALDGAEKRIE